MKKLSDIAGTNYTTVQANVKTLFIGLYKAGYWEKSKK